MVRNRSTRFTTKPPTTTVKKPTPTTTVIKSGAVTTTVTRRTPPPTVSVTSRRTGRPPRTTPTRTTPTPIPTPTPTRTTPTRTKRPTSTFVERSKQAQKRDDFERSLNPFPRAFAEEQPTQVPSSVDRQIISTVVPPPLPTSDIPVRRGGRGGFGIVRATDKDDFGRTFGVVNEVESEFKLTDEQRVAIKTQPRQTIEVQQANNQALLDQGLPTMAQRQTQEGLSDFDKAFASFGGGVNQEIENLGSIAGMGEFREEAGSLAVDLPFAVAGETFTRPSVEKTGGVFGSGGFGGLGFDFRESPDFDAGFEKSGEIQDKIGQKFAEDPARALGSVFAVATIETAIFVGTGGAGKVGLTVAKKFAQVKGRGVAEKIGQKLSEKGVGRAVENLGDGQFLITQGTTAGAKRGLIIGKLDTVAVGLKKALNPVTATFKQVSDNIVLAKTPTLRGITKTGQKGKIPNKRALGLAKEAKEAEIPLIHVNTNAVVNGKRKTVVTLFTKNQIREAGFPTEATIRGLTNPKTVARLGLKQVGETATFAQGKLKGGAVRELRIAEESGATRLVGKGFQFLADDIVANPKTLRQIALTGRTLGGQPARVSTTEIFEAQALGGAKYVRQTGKGIGNIGVALGSKAEARELAKLGLGDVRSLPRRQGGKPFDFSKVDEIGDLGNVFGKAGGLGSGAGKVGSGAGKGTARGGTKQIPRPTQNADDIANIFRQVSKATPEAKIIPRGLGTIQGTGASLGISSQFGFGNLQIPKSKQDDFQRIGIDVLPKIDQKQDQGLGLAGVTPVPQIQRVINTFGEEQPFREPIFRPPRTRQDQDVGTGLITRQDQFFRGGGGGTTDDPIIPTTKQGFGGGAPPPFFPRLDPLRSKKVPRKTKRKSKLGGRLFDIADEPFGEVAVGLGFFVDTERGETSIEDALGIEPEFVPITRQEREARERLGVGKRKRSQSFAEGFGLGDFFN